MEEKQWIGMGLAIMGALFWGLSGTSVQFLENAKYLNVEWLLEVRLLVAGLLTILLAYMKDGIRIFDIFKNPKDFGKLSYSVYLALRWHSTRTLKLSLFQV